MRLLKLKRKKKSTKAITKLQSAHKLLRLSLQFYWHHRRTLLGVLAVAAVFNLLLGLGAGTDAKTLGQSLWFVFASCALIWTIRHNSDAHTHATLGGAYYLGTAPAIKFLLVLVVLSLASLPFSLGLFLYAAVSSVAAGPAVFWQQAIAVGLWSIFGLGSLYLLARLLFSLIVVTLPEINPVASLRISWRLSRGRILSLAGRLMVFVIYGVVLILIPSLGLSALSLPSNLVQIFVQLFGGLFIIPLLYIYIFTIYQQLQ